MLCDKCGKDFPSQYYLDFKKVPGMQLCTDCAAALSQTDVIELRARSGVSRRPAGLAANEYVFPDKCCSCLGPAETQMTVSAQRNEGTVMRTLSVQVPVCRACAKRGKISAYVFAGGIGLGGSVGLLTGGLGGLVAGGLIGFFGGALVGHLATKVSAPASVRMDGAISFRNLKYDALFRAANSRL